MCRKKENRNRREGDIIYLARTLSLGREKRRFCTSRKFLMLCWKCKGVEKI